MGTLDAIHDAILANPRDDLPRLMYADALEEAGNETYAAFIRTMIDGKEHHAAQLLLDEQLAIIPPAITPLAVAHANGVVTLLCDYLQIDFRRGFPQSLVVSGGELYAVEQWLISSYPITYVAQYPPRWGERTGRKASAEIIKAARERHPVPKPYHGL